MNENCILLTGSYDVDKTIVIYNKTELLQKSLQEKEVVYYVEFEEKSNLDNGFREKIKPYEKVKVINGGFIYLISLNEEYYLKKRKMV